MKDILNLYVSATRQNDGKTTTALGLFNAITELFPKVGYIKPIGQQVKMIGKHRIDKDAALMNKVFHIGVQLNDMSPIAVPSGFTENYILHGDVKTLQDKIHKAYSKASRGKNFMVIEGTGHAGVGSVLDLSNAAVAKLLDAPVVIVAGGGIGRPIDEVMLNKAVFDNHGVDVLGVIINKVIPDKYEKIEKFVRLGFERKGIKVLGVIPFYP
ncbi:MAG: AAA family ATPase, partial [Spirochaetota bacterium]